MKRSLALFFVAVSIVILFTPNLVRAQSASDAFSQYTDPHAICDYYRSGQADITTANGIVHPVIERESNNECLVSIGSGKSKTFTQYYYSGDNWCYKLYSGSEVVSSLCVQRPNKSIDLTKYKSYIIGGVIVFAFVITMGAISGNKPPVIPEQPATENTPTYSQPKSVRSKVARPKKRGRIWPELSRWLKLGRKK
ncbi:MAG: hypothetical protein ABSD10_01980 [Candidatus Saccharimonadales bacterium]|jgi:hypothetical protein